MPEPELHVNAIAYYGPVCESGRHAMHPMETCEEIDEVQAVFSAYFERACVEAFEAADRLLVTGNGTGAPLGFLSREPELEPTPAVRAFAILEPELRHCPLYDAGHRGTMSRGGMFHGTGP